MPLSPLHRWQLPLPTGSRHYPRATATMGRCRACRRHLHESRLYRRCPYWQSLLRAIALAGNNHYECCLCSQVAFMCAPPPQPAAPCRGPWLQSAAPADGLAMDGRLVSRQQAGDHPSAHKQRYHHCQSLQ
ncbi:hypothetical protein GW17_00059053 [Ensete ventricosum]|nr:hypothetical protein GW17_00059053 [Ensete ventricosum]